MNGQTIQQLINEARDIITKRYKKGIHEIGCALITDKGHIYKAVHLEAHIGRAAVCAEAIAIGMAATEGDTNISMIVAVNPRGDIVSPCGICRELISDYSEDCLVIMPGDETKLIKELLPHKYTRA